MKKTLKDTLIKTEVYNPFDENQRVEEHALLQAMLVRSVFDLLSADKYVRRDAIRFFKFRGDEPFTYRWICEHLELDYDCLFIKFDKYNMLADDVDDVLITRERSKTIIGMLV